MSEWNVTVNVTLHGDEEHAEDQIARLSDLIMYGVWESVSVRRVSKRNRMNHAWELEGDVVVADNGEERDEVIARVAKWEMMVEDRTDLELVIREVTRA